MDDVVFGFLSTTSARARSGSPSAARRAPARRAPRSRRDRRRSTIELLALGGDDDRRSWRRHTLRAVGRQRLRVHRARLRSRSATSPRAAWTRSVSLKPARSVDIAAAAARRESAGFAIELFDEPPAQRPLRSVPALARIVAAGSAATSPARGSLHALQHLASTLPSRGAAERREVARLLLVALALAASARPGIKATLKAPATQPRSTSSGPTRSGYDCLKEPVRATVTRQIDRSSRRRPSRSTTAGATSRRCRSRTGRSRARSATTCTFPPCASQGLRLTLPVDRRRSPARPAKQVGYRVDTSEVTARNGGVDVVVEPRVSKSFEDGRILRSTTCRSDLAAGRVRVDRRAFWLAARARC